MMQQKSLILGLMGLTLVVMCHGHGRILGGDEADPTATPYAASLRVDNAHVCGGNIVLADKILTTAHCLYRNGVQIDASRLSVRVGSTNQYAGGKIVAVESVVVHSGYYELKNNLAMLTLSSPLVFTDRIEAIEVAASGEDLPAQGSEVSVAGWGYTTDGTSSYKIREIPLTVADDAVCQDAYSEHNEDSFCLAHELKEGTCHGDGGSGAVYAGKLIGLTNFVVGACGSRYPDVFVRLSSYYDWIQEQIAA
ncbi:chymotrypsin-1 [Drosophila eugracilis]|uniref:chymotrypsin-1 n=1 Tax=Drosophila eugracilis TaxID=29029 RepID=UPI0007E5BD2A|nr:chymotrypsin-1 [Drosophila eugracilis]